MARPFRKARRWLLDKTDNKLTLEDMPGYYYKVKHTTIGSSEREVKQVGEFETEFICEGHQYLASGTYEYEKARSALQSLFSFASNVSDHGKRKVCIDGE